MGQASKKFSKQKRYSVNILHQKTYEPVVSTVPRGWLNSHRKSKPKRLTLSRDIQDEVQDKTDNTLDLLAKIAPVRPKRVDSVQMSQRNSVQSGGNSHLLKDRVREIGQNQVWRQMFENTHFKQGDEPPPAPTEGAAKSAFSWREQYSEAIEKVAERISTNRPELPHLTISRPERSEAMDQLMTLGSMIGVCNAPCKPEEL